MKDLFFFFLSHSLSFLLPSRCTSKGLGGLLLVTLSGTVLSCHGSLRNIMSDFEFLILTSAHFSRVKDRPCATYVSKLQSSRGVPTASFSSMAPGTNEDEGGGGLGVFLFRSSVRTLWNPREYFAKAKQGHGSTAVAQEISLRNSMIDLHFSRTPRKSSPSNVT